MWIHLGIAVAGAIVGFVIGASLPQVREEVRRQREEAEGKEAAKLAEQVREDRREATRHEREREELEQVAKMEGRAQILYFERRRQREEQRERETAIEERRRRATHGLGAFLRAIAAWRGLSWLTLLAKELAEGVIEIVHWLSGSAAKADEAPPTLAVAAA